MLKLVSFDTGVKNIGMVVSELAKVSGEVIPIPISYSLVSFKEEDEVGFDYLLESWLYFLKRVKNEFSPDIVVLERVMSRPGRGKAPVEKVGAFCGIAYCVFRNSSKLFFVPAAVWKTWLSRNLKVEPKNFKLPFKDNPHLLDAYCMQLYCIEKLSKTLSTKTKEEGER